MTIQLLSKTLTRSAMAARLGVGTTAIHNAIKRGKFPPSWFRVLKEMATEAGVDCPMCLFAFVPPTAHAEAVTSDPVPASMEYRTSPKRERRAARVAQ